jgi:hypothetical protein
MAADMATEDALFRVMRTTAQTLLSRHLENGSPVDPNQFVEQVFDEFRPVIEFGLHEPALRVRLQDLLRELARPDQ